MNKLMIAVAAVSVLCACQPQNETAQVAHDAPQALNSGIDFEGMNTDIRPQDDFFGYANDGWVSTADIPPDQSGWGSFNILADNGLAQLQTIIEEAADSAAGTRGILR